MSASREKGIEERVLKNLEENQRQIQGTVLDCDPK
jgi:hypothetical protein